MTRKIKLSKLSILVILLMLSGSAFSQVGPKGRMMQGNQGRMGMQQGQHPCSTRLGWQLTVANLGIDDAANAITALLCSPGRQCRQLCYQHRLENPACTKKHSRMQIRQNKNWPLSFFPEQLGMRFPAPRRDLPIDRTRIITTGVNPHFVEFQTPTTVAGAITATLTRSGKSPRSKIKAPSYRTQAY